MVKATHSQNLLPTRQTWYKQTEHHLYQFHRTKELNTYHFDKASKEELSKLFFK